jgi:DNA-binding transcriptional ArsR family regulator
MNLETLQSQAAEAEALLKAMANQARLMILCELLDGERTVTELHLKVGLAMSAVSQHLAKLREERIVSTRRESQTIYYSLASEPAEKMLAVLYEIFCAPAAKGGAKKKQRSAT